MNDGTSCDHAARMAIVQFPPAGAKFKNDIVAEKDAEIARLRKALIKARDIFILYSKLHSAKMTTDADIKAIQNRLFAEQIDDALVQPGEKEQG